MKKLVMIVSLMLIASVIVIPFAPGNWIVASSSLPDYVPVYENDPRAGVVKMPSVDSFDAKGGVVSLQELESTPDIGTWVWDWYLSAISEAYRGVSYPYMQLRAVVGNVEVWVAQDEALMYLPGDPRNNNPLDWQITDEMAEYIAEEFDSVIYPTDTYYFGAPFDRDGTYTIFEYLNWPEFTYDWIETDTPQRVIIKIFNIVDDGFFDPTYPYYVVGFYSSLYTQNYYNRNMIHIDNWRWWQRLGPEGTQWYPDNHPELTVTRPYVYESTVAHEYQHNIHRDWQPEGELWMNEGCSMYAEIVCGYGVSLSYFNSYFATPDNSLIEWGDQGDINILADYGVVALWTAYLSDHYGGGDIIRTYVQSGITGIEGINNALETLGYTETFDDVYNNWRLANLIRHGAYNYRSIDLTAEEIIPIRMYDVSGMPVPWTKGTDFGNTVTILDYDTGISRIGPYGSDYIAIRDWDKPGLIFFDGDDTVGWTMTEEGSWYSGAANLFDTLLVGTAYVSSGQSMLEIVTKYDIEPMWDFGFVQVSTDGGETWSSLENKDTTYEHDPDAHPEIVANLPGLTGTSKHYPDWVSMKFDLKDYKGQTVTIGFRYMTDWVFLLEGWYILEATIGGTPLDLTPALYLEADFQVTVIYAFDIDGRTVYLPAGDIALNDETETGFTSINQKQPFYVILVISPVRMPSGFADYAFRVEGTSG